MATEQLKNRLDEHEEVHERFDRRITQNENWRLQMIGALKFAAFVTGTALAIFGVVVSLGIV